MSPLARRRLIATIIALALAIMWIYVFNRLDDFGYVPPVPAWWPVSTPVVGHSMAYYGSLAVVLFGVTAAGVWQIRRLLRGDRRQ